MSENMSTGNISRGGHLSGEVYRDTMYFVSAMVREFRLYPEIFEALKNGNADIEFRRRVMLRAVDETWVRAIEDSLIALDEIIRKPSRFIEETETVLPIELTKNITDRSVRHLSQHTDYISKVEGDTVIPSKILNVFRDETMLTYENKFINTLLSRLYTFVNRRYKAAKSAGADTKNTSVEFRNNFTHSGINGKITFRLELEEPATDGDVAKNYVFQSDLWKRIEKIHSVCDAYMQSSFVRDMGKNYVRPPIMRTNAILKNKNLRQCLALWTFIESYENTGYSTTVEDKLFTADDEYIKELYSTMAMEYLLFRYRVTEGFGSENEIAARTSDTPLTPEIVEDLMPPELCELALHFPSVDRNKGERTAVEADVLRAIEISVLADRLLYERSKLEELSEKKYDKSFKARFILSGEPTQSYYTEIKNFVRRYPKIKSRSSWKHESFTYGRKLCMRLVIKGKTLYAFLPLDAGAPENTKYRLEDMSEYNAYKQVPAALKIKSDRAVKRLKILLSRIFEGYGLNVSDEILPEDYRMPMQTVDELIALGLIKVLKTPAGISKRQIRETEDNEDLLSEIPVSDDERAESGTGTEVFSKSYLAKMILSQEPTQTYYTEIKNQLLKYEGIKYRISWKHEMFYVGRKVLAVLFVSGKTLYVALPLSPGEISVKYKVADYSANRQFEKTPSVIKVKSERALKAVRLLIEQSAEKLGLIRNENAAPDKDYHMPLQSRRQMITAGFIKAKNISGRDFLSRVRLKTAESDSGISEVKADLISGLPDVEKTATAGRENKIAETSEEPEEQRDVKSVTSQLEKTDFKITENETGEPFGKQSTVASGQNVRTETNEVETAVYEEYCAKIKGQTDTVGDDSEYGKVDLNASITITGNNQSEAIRNESNLNVSTDNFPDLTGGLSLKTVKTADFEKISDVADDVKETSPILTKKQYNFQTATYDAEMKVTTDNKGKTTESTESKNVKSSIRKLLEKFHRDKK